MNLVPPDQALSPAGKAASGHVPRALGVRPVSVEEFSLQGAERWFVVQALHHREGVAEDHLRAQGFRPYVPRFRKTVRHARKLRTIEAPLFPGYFFVIINPERDRWRSINGTYGVARLITAYERMMPVPAGVVEALLERCDLSGVVRLDDGLAAGQRVRVLTGPFAQMLGQLERLDHRGRVRVLLDIMGGKVAAELDRSALSKA